MNDNPKPKKGHMFSVLVFRATLFVVTITAINGKGGVLHCQKEIFLHLYKEGRIECNITGNFQRVFWSDLAQNPEEPFIRFIKNNMKVSGRETGPNGKYDLLENGTLIIKNVTGDAKYKITVIWIENDSSNMTIPVTVIEPPLREYPSIKVCNITECECRSENCHICTHRKPKLFACEMEGKPRIDLTWYNRSSGLAIKKQTCASDSFPWEKTITSRSEVEMNIEEDITALTCTPSGRAVPPSSRNATLLLITPSEDFISKESIYIEKGKQRVISCNGNFSQVFWIKQETGNHPDVPNCSDIDASRNGTITISNFTKDDEGIYTCVWEQERDFLRVSYKVQESIPPDRNNSCFGGCIFPNECKRPVSNLTEEKVMCKVVGTQPGANISCSSSSLGLKTIQHDWVSPEERLSNSWISSQTMIFALGGNCSPFEVTCHINGPWSGSPYTSRIEFYCNETTPSYFDNGQTPSAHEPDDATTGNSGPAMPLPWKRLLSSALLFHIFRCDIMRTLPQC